MNNEKVECSICGLEYDASFSACPRCNSTVKTYHKILTAFAKVGSSIRGKVREKAFIGKKHKDALTFYFGDDFSRKLGKFVYRMKKENRENNQYDELVKDKETGEVICKCSELLTDHKNHGSAKKNKSAQTDTK